jgi:hypothetical protein
MLATKLGLQFQQADGLLKQLAEYQMIVPTGWPDASIPLYNVSPHGYEVAEELQLVNRLRFGFRNG